jgi:hypothetical protein
MTAEVLARAFDAAVVIAILAVLIERGLAVIFEYSPLIQFFGRTRLKEPIAIIVSYLFCRWLGLDAFSYVVHGSGLMAAGVVMTALTVSGGSKGSQKLFQDFLDIKSSAERAKQARQ